MTDVDRILEQLEQLLENRRAQESALFSARTFADQPLIERGRDLQKRQERMRRRERSRDVQERMKQRDEERAERRQQAAEARYAARQHQHTGSPRAERPPQTTDKGPYPTAPDYQTTLWPAEFDRNYRNEPDSISSRPAPAALPEPIRQIRLLEGTVISPSIAYGSHVSSKLFYEQARLLEDYEDDYAFDGGFFQYFPTYSAMNNHQLRGYLSWRTQIRRGNVERAPLSFAFVYVYELLCGIGTTPGRQGLEDLRRFGAAFREASPYDGERLMRYLRQWMQDYAIYHDIASAFSSTLDADTDQSALTLLVAEHALLNQAGLEPKSGNAAATQDPPSHEELFRALSCSSTYRLDQSRLAKDEPELLAQVTADVFAALVVHCARRRKVDFVEGLFGFARNTPYAMFSSAVFYEPTPHPDCFVRVSPIEAYACTNGRWRHQLAFEMTDRNSELGRYLHEIDYELRHQLDYAYPLKPRTVPKYVERMVQKAAATRLKERADAEEASRRAEEEAERRRITIDRSKLRGIRTAAAQTREALLTDEERGLEPVAVVPAAGAMPSPAAGATPSPAAGALGVTPIAPDTPSAQEVPTASAAPSAACAAVATYGLTEVELRVLAGLVAHTPTSELLGPTDPFASVVVDTINEKLFDLVGDTLIEFDGDEPSVIEDYLEDIREVL